MRRRKKTLKGLGHRAEVHGDEAAVLAQRVIERAEDVGRKAGEGKCGSAIQGLVYLAETFGGAHSHAAAARKGVPMYTEARTTLSNMTRTVINACIPSDQLGGSPRRRRKKKG